MALYLKHVSHPMQGTTDMEATGSDVPSEIRLAGRGLSEKERTQQLAGAPPLLPP